jgi:predicted Zn-dependent protease
MKGVKQLFIAGLLLMFFACNPLKQLETTQSSAQTAYEAASYSEALTLYEQLIQLYKENGKDIPVDIKMNAGKSAYEIKKYDTAKGYLTEVFNENKEIEQLMMLIDISKQSGSSDELKSLIKNNIDLLKENGKGDLAYVELFNMNYAAGDMEAAYSNYNKIENPGEELFDEYLDILVKLDKKKEAKEVCTEALNSDVGNKAALEWLAIDEYTNAEKWYKSMMAKYNKNKNATSYAYLRRDLKKVSAQYRNARNKFLKLRTIDPGNKKYIRYLKNCYLRLEMKDKAAEMDKLLK